MAKKPSTPRVSTIQDLREEYPTLIQTAERLRKGIDEQLRHIVSVHSLALAVPIESRIKSWSSIEEKYKRKNLHPGSLADLPDLIGLRMVFLFSRHLREATKSIRDSLSVIAQEDASTRLDESQFGYQSIHYIVRIPNAWTTVPTFVGCEKLKAEIQIRTIAQHTWAVASHHLQYKREGSVPSAVRRSINRVSALLETVDLEFERVLNERDEYVTHIAEISPNERLNVDVLTAVLNEILPEANRESDELYDELVADLESADIVDVKSLKDLADTHLESTLRLDGEIVSGEHSGYNFDEDLDRISRGVFFTHVGLVRTMLEKAGKWSPSVEDVPLFSDDDS